MSMSCRKLVNYTTILPVLSEFDSAGGVLRCLPSSAWCVLAALQSAKDFCSADFFCTDA